MECSLALLLACFRLANLYVGGDISYQDQSVPYYYWRNVSPPPSSTGAVETAYVWTLAHENPNPYSRASIGFKLPFKSIDLSAEAFYQSSLASDRVEDVKGIAIRAQWFPFR